ncbi:MAG: M2 family metallopeptidase [Caulobacterales bacterium]|nr:M2 family metallopeptidase [Caulobacterales bacterium]
MKRVLLSAAAACALAACASMSPSAPAASSTTESAERFPATPDGARAFVLDAETRLMAMSEYAGRVSWVRNTYITFDTMWLEARANAEYTELGVELANAAARFNDVDVDAETRRKLNLLRQGLVAPAPNRPGAADELAQILTRMDSTYATGRFTYNGQEMNLDDASALIAESRDPAVTAAVYNGWRTISAQGMATDYARMVEIINEGAGELGYSDAGAMWRSGYDMPADEFAAETDRLWGQVRPFYENLHCYVRTRLNARYGDDVQPATGPIRADLLGNMWSQQWGNIYDVVAPTDIPESSVDLTEILEAHEYTPERVIRTSEQFYTSIGLDALPGTFWERSQIVRPEGREVVCHASAWDIDNLNDLRIKMCTRVNAEDFQTAHHELGHNYYQRAYNQQPFLFRNGANDGFHEAIGDFAALSAATPEYLNQIGLLETVPGTDEDIPYLLRMALDKIAFMPFGLMVDRWRWGVLSGETTPAQYNAAWTDAMLRYQGLVPPGGARPADAFDPGAKYHVPGNVPYTRYFLAHIYQFQFHRAACQMAGWTGPLHRCSVYGNEEVGRRFNAMMEMGQSRPWPEALAAFTGESRTDASAVAEYFAPLDAWLTEQNRGQDCGWGS